MTTFPLKISSPEGDLFCGDAVMLSLRGTEGELAVMAGHIPFVTSLVEAPVTILLEDDTERKAFAKGAQGQQNINKRNSLGNEGVRRWRYFRG